MLSSGSSQEKKTSVSFAEKPPLVVIFLGPPGSGKGTHAQPVSRYFGLPHISTGDLFRYHMERKTSLGKKIDYCMQEGRLVENELVFSMLFSRLQEPDCQNGYLLDGFPRSFLQAKHFATFVSSDIVTVAIHLDVSDAIIKKRVLGRFICKNCQATFHKVFYPPKKEGVCDGCNDILVQRSDDNETTITNRLTAYHQEIDAVLRYYQESQILYNVPACGTKETILSQVLTTIEKHISCTAS